ncbi:MAG: BatA domain-containing protein [Phycisphaerales bacterium]|nr:BatA domain-containing protein [Phycisphaerales bacterium]
MLELSGQASGFLHPGLGAAGLAAASIPVVIHLLNRRRHRRIPWAAMAFLLAATRQSRSRIFLEHWVLLAIRAAVVLLLGLAAARPFLSSASFAVSSAARAHRIILLDDSLSAQAKIPAGVGTRFDALRQRAQELIEAFPADDAVSLVTLSASGEPVRLAEAVDRRAALDRLSMIEPTFLAGDLHATADAIRGLIDRSTILKRNQSVYLLTDLAEVDWDSSGQFTTGASAVAQLASDCDLTVFQPLQTHPPNVALTRFELQNPLVGIGFPARFEAEVVNFGPRVLRGVTLQVKQGDRIAAEVALPPIEPGARAVEQGVVHFTDAGTFGLTATLTAPSDNALAADDRRDLSIEVRRSVGLLLVDGRPGATRMEGQAGYLATALSPQTQRGEPGLFDPKVITDLELPGEVFDEYDLIALCNVQRLAEESWMRLEGFTRAGGALLIFGGDLVSADHYNRHAATPAHPLLPGTLGGVVTAVEGDHAWTRLKLTDPPHPLTADFALMPESGLFLARVEKYLAIEPDAKESQIALGYGNGDPALVVRRLGEGACAVFTSTANMDWNNLPGKGDYVALLLSLTSSMLPQRGAHRNVTVGATIAEPLRVGQGSMQAQATSPSGKPLRGTLLQSGMGPRLTFSAGPVLEPGLMHVQVGGESRPFAVNGPAGESNLRAIETARLTSLLGERATILSDDANFAAPTRTLRASDLGGTALAGVLALLLMEMMLAASLGGGRAESRRSPA